ncbi:hypothetical protein FRB90_000667 [Tulasnella sp. 427]|nr:hypothetical protein FRB90_000667 [Tulasnella sp. 427]
MHPGVGLDLSQIQASLVSDGIAVANRKPERGSQWSDAISAIIDNPSAPLNIAKYTAKLSFECLDSSESIEATDFLSGILRDQPADATGLRLAAPERSSEMDDGEDKTRLDKLVGDIALGLSITGIQGRSLAIASDDVHERLSGLRELLDEAQADSEVSSDVQAKLLACLRDTDEAKTSLPPSLPPEARLQQLDPSSRCTSNPLRAALWNDLDARIKVFQEAFVSNLLFTKSRAKQAAAAWDLLLDADRTMNDSGILSGCGELVRLSDSDADAMAEMNLKLSGKFAENAIYLEKTEPHLDFFLAKLTDNDPYL